MHRISQPYGIHNLCIGTYIGIMMKFHKSLIFIHPLCEMKFIVFCQRRYGLKCFSVVAKRIFVHIIIYIHAFLERQWYLTQIHNCFRIPLFTHALRSKYVIPIIFPYLSLTIKVSIKIILGMVYSIKVFLGLRISLSFHDLEHLVGISVNLHKKIIRQICQLYFSYIILCLVHTRAYYPKENSPHGIIPIVSIGAILITSDVRSVVRHKFLFEVFRFFIFHL